MKKTNWTYIWYPSLWIFLTVNKAKAFKAKFQMLDRLFIRWAQDDKFKGLYEISGITYIWNTISKSFCFLAYGSVSCQMFETASKVILIESIKGQCYHQIETSQLICRANQLTGFCMKRTLVFFGLTNPSLTNVPFYTPWKHEKTPLVFWFFQGV